MILELSKARGSKRARTRDQLLVSAQALLMEQNAAALGIRQITDHAGMVHATFYNYYQDVAALIADLAELLGASHAATIASSLTGVSDPAVRFARITRQTLRMVTQEPGLGRLIFDVGLPADSLVSELRFRLKLDLAEGQRLGRFRLSDVDLAASMVSGAISGLALDLHRQILPVAMIEPATTRLLELLGFNPEAAAALGHEMVVCPPAPALPMRWLALVPVRPADQGDRR
jgi:AcrR family transcriptional regulator